MVDVVIAPDQARVLITWDGKSGDLPDPILFDSTDADIKGWVSEAIRTNSIPAITFQGNVDLTDFVVDRFRSSETNPTNTITVRPKVPFG